MNAKLDTTKNWYSIQKCDYPTNYHRLVQHAFTNDEDAFLNQGITNTVICEGEYSALRQIVQQQQLDCIG
jgi:hypothetical protein